MQVIPNPNASKPGQAPNMASYYYWVLSINGSAKVIWERLIPANDKGGTDKVTASLSPEGDIIFAAARNSIGTELFILESDGSIKAKTVLPDSYQIVSTPSAEQQIRLISVLTPPVTLITLNNQLKQTARVSAEGETGLIEAAYMLPNGTFITFGWLRRSSGGNAYVLKLDKDLHRLSLLDVDPKGGSHSVTAASFSITQDGFISARGALADNLSPKPFSSGTDDKESRLGAVIEFIQ